MKKLSPTALPSPSVTGSSRTLMGDLRSARATVEDDSGTWPPLCAVALPSAWLRTFSASFSFLSSASSSAASLAS